MTSRRVLTFVLAGGAGERLRPLSARRCKPAVHFGGGFRVVDFTLMNCVTSSLREVFLLAQYRAASLESHCQRRWGFLSRTGDGFVRTLSPAGGEQRYAGTADAVYRGVLNGEPRSGVEAVLVLSGDHVYHADYRRLLEFHAAARADVTILAGTVPASDASAYGVLEVAGDSRVTRFVEKPRSPQRFARRGSCWINLGVYCFEPRFLLRSLCEDAGDPHSSHDFGRDVLPRTLEQGARVHACALARVAERPYWRDVGTIASFFEANMDLVGERPRFQLDNPLWAADAPFRDWAPRELPPGACCVGARHHSTCLAAPSARWDGATLRRVVLSAGVRVEPGAHLEDCVLLPGAHVASGARLRRIIVDEGTYVPAQTEIGFGREDAPPLVLSGPGPSGDAVVDAGAHVVSGARSAAGGSGARARTLGRTHGDSRA